MDKGLRAGAELSSHDPCKDCEQSQNRTPIVESIIEARVTEAYYMRALPGIRNSQWNQEARPVLMKPITHTASIS